MFLLNIYAKTFAYSIIVCTFTYQLKHLVIMAVKYTKSMFPASRFFPLSETPLVTLGEVKEGEFVTFRTGQTGIVFTGVSDIDLLQLPALREDTVDRVLCEGSIKGSYLFMFLNY